MEGMAWHGMIMRFALAGMNGYIMTSCFPYLCYAFFQCFPLKELLRFQSVLSVATPSACPSRCPFSAILYNTNEAQYVKISLPALLHSIHSHSHKGLFQH